MVATQIYAKIRFDSKKAIIGLLSITLLIMLALWHISEVSDSLMPESSSLLAWKPMLSSDKNIGGSSEISLGRSGSELQFDFFLTNDVEYPFVTFFFEFADRARPETVVDLSKYSSLALTINCSPANFLTLNFYTYDFEITRPGEFGTYRLSRAYFSCIENTHTVHIDLTKLEVQDWWLMEYGARYSDRTYRRDKVAGFAIANSHESPTEIRSQISINSAVLLGRNWYYTYAGGVVACILWGAYAVWYAKHRTAQLIEKSMRQMQQDRPVIAYQKVNTVTSEDRDRNALLGYLEVEYENQELDLETVENALGINRNKINDILRAEASMTFSVYLTKLRLVEAARRLSVGDKSVMDVAFSVGYSSASYFTAVFKKEYGCTPSAYRNVRVAEASGSRPGL